MDKEPSPGRAQGHGRAPGLLRWLSRPKRIAAALVVLAVVAAAAVLVTLSGRNSRPTASAAPASSRHSAAQPASSAASSTAVPAKASPAGTPAASVTVSPTAAPRTSTPTPSPIAPPPPAGQVVRDDTGDISVLVPDSWTSVEGDGWHPMDLPPFPNGTDIGPGLNASTNVSAWFQNLTTPGIFAGASSSLPAAGYTPDTLLQHIGFNGCAYSSSQPYAISQWTGTLDTLTCTNSSTRWWDIAMWPQDHSYIICVQIKIVTQADETAGNQALASLSVNLG
jgi:hypothetical protein